MEGQYQLQGTLSVPSIRDSTIFSHIVKLLHGNVHKETAPSNIFTSKLAWKTEIGIQIASVALFAREAYRDKSYTFMPCPIYKYSLHDMKDFKIYSSTVTEAIQFLLNYPKRSSQNVTWSLSKYYYYTLRTNLCSGFSKKNQEQLYKMQKKCRHVSREN